MPTEHQTRNSEQKEKARLRREEYAKQRKALALKTRRLQLAVGQEIHHDDLLRCLINESFLPEDCVEIAAFFPNGNNSWLIAAIRRDNER